MNDASVKICLVSSDEYVPYLSVTLESIRQNCNSDNSYEIMILTTDMTPRNQNIITKMFITDNNISIHFINVNQYVEQINFYTWAHFTKFTYYRLCIPYILENLDKIIYMDSDVVVNTDLYNLYNIDVESAYICATRDTHVVGTVNPKCPYYDSYYENELGIQEPINYIQAGVMLMNLSRIRTDFPDFELLKIASENKFRWLDQDLINKYFQGNIKYIDNYWNLMIFNDPEHICEYYLEGDIHLDYFTSRDNPGIIHYVGRGMPCFNPWGDMFWYYWKYARSTPYYELILSTMIDQKLMKESQRLNDIFNHQSAFLKLKNKIKSKLKK